MPVGILGRNNGTDLNFGFAGKYARQSKMIIHTRPNKGTTDIIFGSPVMLVATTGYNGANVGGVTNVTADLTMDNFVGFAAAEVKVNTGVTIFEQGPEYGGRYVPNEPVGVFEEGSISVICAEGNPTVNGPVWIRTAVGGSGQPIGNICATEPTEGGLLLTNAKWNTPKDNRDVAEVRLFVQANV